MAKAIAGRVVQPQHLDAGHQSASTADRALPGHQAPAAGLPRHAEPPARWLRRLRGRGSGAGSGPGRRRTSGRAGPCRAGKPTGADVPRRRGVCGARYRGARLSSLGLPGLRSRLAQCGGCGAAHDGAVAPGALPLLGREAAHPVDDRQRHPAARAAARQCRGRKLLGGPWQLGFDRRSRGLARSQRFPALRRRARHGRICGAGRHRRSLRTRHAASGAARLLRSYAGIDPLLRSGDAALGGSAPGARPRPNERGAAHDRHDPPVPPELCRGLRRPDPQRCPLYGGQRGPAASWRGTLAAAVLRQDRHAVRLCRALPDPARSARRSGGGGAVRQYRGSLRGPRRSPQAARLLDLQAAAARRPLPHQGRVARSNSNTRPWFG